MSAKVLRKMACAALSARQEGQSTTAEPGLTEQVCPARCLGLFWPHFTFARLATHVQVVFEPSLGCSLERINTKPMFLTHYGFNFVFHLFW